MRTKTEAQFSYQQRTDVESWRCRACRKLLGKRQGSVVLIQFARGHCYRAQRPLSAVCRGCGTLNET